MIDAVRAARRVEPRLSDRWFAVGHSQGGQSALAASEIAGRYGDGLDLLGAVAFAPAPNMSVYADQVASDLPFQQAYYSMMLMGLKTQHRSLRWGDYLGDRARALLPHVRELCFDELIETFTRADLPASEFAPRNEAAERRLRRWFLTNEVGHRPADAPVLAVAGSNDATVPPVDVRAIVRAFRDQGSPVTYRELAGLDHHQVVDAALPDTLRWLGERLHGRAPR